MSADTLYRKRGRRYHAVAWHDTAIWEAIPEGSHLLVVHPGGQSVRLRIDPDHARVLAAIQTHREALLAAIEGRLGCPERGFGAPGDPGVRGDLHRPGRHGGGEREIADLLRGRTILAGSHRRWMRLEMLARALRARLGL